MLWGNFTQNMQILEKEMFGWGRFPRSRSKLARPEKLSSLSAIVRESRDPLLARGEGKSYGDAALNANRLLVETSRLNRLIDFDRETGILRCEAGVTLAELLDVFVPRGWFPAVLPGTTAVSVGGAFAADIHGKNHHRSGSFADHVLEIELLLANGERVRASRHQNTELFWATAGGMGLTGILVELKMKLFPIESSYVRVETRRLDHLDSILGCFLGEDQLFEYSVAWIDCQAKGKNLGRGLLMRANPTHRDDLHGPAHENPFPRRSNASCSLPFEFPSFAINRLSVGLFNAFVFRRPMDDLQTEIMPFERYFFPLDSIRDWNRVYGRQGFLQYQFVIAGENRDATLQEILERMSQSSVACPLGVLKQFGVGHGMLSFPKAGYTLAVDMPASASALNLLESLDELVIRSNGRVYLAKDSRISAFNFRRMYPEFPAWLAVKKKFDPDFRFQSDLSRRLRFQEGA